jgi:hypothetical protein
VFRLVHYSQVNKVFTAGTNDFTDVANFNVTKGFTGYTYETQLISEIKYSQHDNSLNYQFKGQPILFPKFTTANKLEISTTNFFVDVWDIETQPSSYNAGQNTFLIVEVDDNDTIIMDVGILGGYPLANYKLSISEIIGTFDAPGITIWDMQSLFCLGGEITDATRLAKRKAVEFAAKINIDSINFAKLARIKPVSTNIDTCEIISVTMPLNGSAAKIKVRYA